MFAYCTKCKEYESGDRDTLEELKIEIEDDGGKLTLSENGYTGTCPNCGGIDSIVID